MTYAPKDPGPRLAATCIVFNVSRTKGLKPIISEKKMKDRDKEREKEEINKWNKRKEQKKGSKKVRDCEGRETRRGRRKKN